MTTIPMMMMREPLYSARSTRLMVLPTTASLCSLAKLERVGGNPGWVGGGWETVTWVCVCAYVWSLTLKCFPVSSITVVGQEQTCIHVVRLCVLDVIVVH